MSKSLNVIKRLVKWSKLLVLNLKKVNPHQLIQSDFGRQNLSRYDLKYLMAIEDTIDEKSIEIIIKVHFLLKNKGMTINGVKKFLDEENSLNLDENLNHS